MSPRREVLLHRCLANRIRQLPALLHRPLCLVLTPLLAMVVSLRPLGAQELRPAALGRSQTPSSASASPVLPALTSPLLPRAFVPATLTGASPEQIALSTPLGVQAARFDRDKARWWTPLASLIVPGSGQVLMKQQRGFGYLVLESYLLVQAAAAQRTGNREREAYRRVAADVARSSFGGARPHGDWPYYEAMESFLESGTFDAVPGGNVEPESDATTFNGAQWLLARETFWNDPDDPPPPGSAEYQRALDFYLGRAVRDGFLWSWRDAQLQQDVYRQNIASANRNYQRAINFTGAVVANHLLSMVDAYVTVRMRRFAGATEGQSGPEFSSSVELHDGMFGTELRHTVSVFLPLPGRERR